MRRCCSRRSPSRPGAIATSASATPPRAPSPAAATAAFGRLLHQLYAGIDGYWTCPPPAINGRIDCRAEVHVGRRRHGGADPAYDWGGLITCRNALGDAMRYRPRP